MSNSARPSVPKWPFFLGNALMLGAALLAHYESPARLDHFYLAIICGCVAIGAFLGVLPFILEYRIALRLAESESLTSAVERLQNLEGIANQISLATGQWQTVQEYSTKAVTAATEIGDRMTQEAKAFAEFMKQANDSEKSTLRLEVEKLHRAETEWVQTVVRMLDHTYALHTAAVRSGKTALVQQLTQFQNAMREGARRLGLIPIIAEPGETFDAQKHQTAEAEKPADGAPIYGTLATGYTFRGKLIRPVLVATQVPAAPATSAPEVKPADPRAEEPTLL
jgi:molecular chaperone GrpE (heat shock protein)